ncbi:MAG: hypothetical protein L6428_10340 [Candidatus Aminicenantes bacterium]|nr:hypothetical protein [Acidobacteriota bacterium]MCG2811841.1 hypothetical protein [Candidatus Aminicenantes bacterium]
MRRIFSNQSNKTSKGDRAGSITKYLLFLFIIGVGFSMSQATEFRLFRTPKTGNVVTLTAPAKIMQVSYTQKLESFSIWRNNSLYFTVSPFKFTEKNSLKGILPPGEYVLRTLGGSVTIFLNTVFKPENVALWGMQTALVDPRWDGNVIVICSPTKIISAAYTGTDSMGIFAASQPRRAFLKYLSPHNHFNPGPKVFNSAGVYLGKTLEGQTLLPGVYTITPGRGTADGIVNGHIVFQIK